MKTTQAGNLVNPRVQIDDGTHYDLDDESVLPYQYMDNLGHGGTAVVDRIRHIQTDQVYARKSIKVLPSKLKTVRVQCTEEVRILRRLAQHHHFVRVVASYNTSNTLALIMYPAANGGNLKTFLDQFAAEEDPVNTKSMTRMVRRAYGCLASGLAFMHQHKIRHRDIKPENILIHSGSIIFADFGVARDYSDKAHSVTEDYPGPFTRKYCAPEVKDFEKRSWKSDVFSLGCVYLLMYTAMYRYPKLEEIAKGRFYEQLDEIQMILATCEEEREVLQCMKGMIQLDEQKRPFAGEVVRVLLVHENRHFCGRCREAPLNRNFFVASMCSIITSSNITTRDTNIVNTGTSSLPSPLGTHCAVLGGVTRSKLANEAVLRPLKGATRQHELNFEAIHSQAIVPHQQYMMAQSEIQALTGTDGNSLAIEAFSQTPSPHYRDRLVRVQSMLSRYGVRHHKIVRASQSSNRREDVSDTQELGEGSIYEDYVYEWATHYFGYGIRMSKRKPYGNILPTLSTYPVVAEFDTEWTLLQQGSLVDIQRSVAKGDLHPYVQTPQGESLFNIALAAHRIDVCHLLLNHGVQPWSSYPDTSLLVQIACACEYLPVATAIDLLRFTFSRLQDFLDFADPSWIQIRSHLQWHPEITLWLCRTGPEYDIDSHVLREFGLRMVLRGLHLFLPGQKDRAEDLLIQLLSPDVVLRINNRELVLLDDLFYPLTTGKDEDPADAEDLSWDLGHVWISALQQRGIDVLAYLIHEREGHPRGLLEDTSDYWMEFAVLEPDEERAIVYGFSEEKGYQVGWRYASDFTPGDLVMTVFESLTWNVECEWPFGDEVDVKSCGQGEVKIPGSWVD